MSSVHPDLSIVIPAYNEELRLPATLERLAEYLPTLGLQTEVLIVDDGSRDRTAAVAASFAAKISGLRVLSNGTNRGKGYSVRHGMLEATGELVLFTDADLSAPIEESDKLISALKNGYDVAIGSRALNRSLISTHESLFREFAGIIFNKIVRVVLWLPFVDTQCGFKAFRRERCRIIFELQRIEGFGFDPRAAVPGAALWIAGHRDSGALGAFAGHESEHAAGQFQNVYRYICDSVERAEREICAVAGDVGFIRGT